MGRVLGVSDRRSAIFKGHFSDEVVGLGTAMRGAGMLPYEQQKTYQTFFKTGLGGEGWAGLCGSNPEDTAFNPLSDLSAEKAWISSVRSS